MRNILLLYDTLEKDLARDIKDFLSEIGMENIITIPMEADRGLTLQDKEMHYIESAAGAIFIITPGSERLGKLFPSPSVAEEMGQVKQKFKKYPERIIYLMDKRCNLQSIDQRSYISFDRTNIRSVIEALTQLIKNLKISGLLMIDHTEIPTVSQADILELLKSIDSVLINICLDLSKVPNGAMESSKFDQHLKGKYLMDDQAVNLVKRKLRSKDLVNLQTTQNPYPVYWWMLTNLGWEIVDAASPFAINLGPIMKKVLEDHFKGK